ncbi:unnamed protein product [Xylocopa violacea]|uniref:Uncharacterized protein n=1 Tax=Xylocopa violacea TaxID=135666 RepID=A0ABP1NPL4_XYLVO
MDTHVLDQTRYCKNKIKKNKQVSDEDVKDDSSLRVLPSELKFTFDFGNFKTQGKVIEVINYSSKPCPVRFLPLQTHYFKIKNTFQTTWLNPESVIKVNILFMPDENRDYNDVLKIRYFNNQIMETRILAKVISKFSFPTSIDFGNVPLGRTVCYNLPIHSHAEKEFSFAIFTHNGDSSVDVYPRWGHVKPKQKPVMVMVIYRPLRYISMNFQVRIFISDLYKAPYNINFYAYTRPGLLR